MPDKSSGMAAIGPEQCRAGRMLLGWSQARLASVASLSRSTIVEFERGASVPHENSRHEIAKALAGAGIEFLSDDGAHGMGVRLRQSEIELAGSAVRRDQDWILVPLIYRGRRRAVLVAATDLEVLAGRRFFGEDQINESVTKFRDAIVRGAMELFLSQHHDTESELPIVPVARFGTRSWL